MLAVGWRIDRRLTVSLLAMTVLTNLAMTLRALWFALLIDAVIDGRITAATVWAVVLAVSDATRSWALVGSQMDRQDLHDRALQHFQEESMLLAGGLAGIEHHERDDHIDRLAAYRQSFASLSAALGNVAETVANVVRAAVTLALLLTLHPALILLPVFAVPSLVAARRGERIRQTANLESINPGRQGDHLYDLVIDPAPAKEVKVLGIGPELRSRQARLWEDVTVTQQRARRRAALVSLAGWIIFAAGYIGTLALLVTRAAEGQATTGDVLLGVILAGQINSQVATGADLISGLTQAGTAIAHRRWLLDYATAHHTSPGTATCPDRLDHGITLRQVSFRYPGTDTDVLHDIDLHLPAGAVVAVVGENGAGKTTLVKLLARLYQPTRGTITLDSTRLGDIDLQQWRRHLTAAFQDFARYHFTAHDVVGVGDLTHLNDVRRVTAALDRAAAGELLEALPDGLDTQLGVAFGGIEISGGQWQKLALGRAMMRPEPLLLILDEPTAALDPPTEHHLFERYAQASRSAASANGAITVLVSHRFSTVRHADLIIVLDAGRVIQTGTHRQLMADPGGLYAQLYDIGARAYR
jgi:ATP-binding cassette subfamily B protein